MVKIKYAILASGIFFLSLTFGASVSRADDWKPVDPAELQSKTPVVERDADAEAIFWEVRVQDEFDGGSVRTILWHYIRIKIYTDRGRELHGNVDIEFTKSTKIDNIAARTIKSDGKILDLEKKDVFERTLAKAGGRKINVKSFALPGVEPGAIIEYRWKETRNDSIAQYMRLEFQRDIPIRLVKYYIKPLDMPSLPFGMKGQTFHGQTTPMVKEKDGFVSTTMTNVPAFHEEPRMPPHHEVRPWMLIFYAEDKKQPPEKFWSEYAKDKFDQYKGSLKPNDDVKRAAAATIGDATTPDQKLARIFEFCRTKIKNINSVASGVSAEQREKAKENKNPGDTLKRGQGDGEDIDMLFGAMAAASGFDVRFAKMPNRGDVFFSPDFTNPYFLTTYDIAVRVGDKWLFFDPGSPYIPYGMLNWQEEGVRALICDPKEGTFVSTPLSTPDKSKITRVAKLRLSEDGTLEGDVHIQYSGHESVSMKRAYEDDSPAEREKTLTESVKGRMSTAELSNIRIENVTDQEKPFTFDYNIKVPGYAQRTGKRLFVQPEFFQYGVAAMFPTSERKYPVYFSFPWSEDDTVLIEVPNGYELDHADAPGPLSAGAVCAYDVKINFNSATRTIGYKRTFFFGGSNSILYPATSYSQVKQLFDVLHERDTHTITLKQAAAPQ